MHCYVCYCYVFVAIYDPFWDKFLILDVRIRRYFSKPKEVRKEKSLGNNEIDGMRKTLHYVAFALPLLPRNRNNTVHSYCCRWCCCQQYKSGSAAREMHLSCNKIFPTSVNSSKCCYARGLRKWLPQFICINFIIVGLNTKSLRAQHISLLSYNRCYLLGSVRIHRTILWRWSRLCSFRTTVDAP